VNEDRGTPRPTGQNSIGSASALLNSFFKLRNIEVNVARSRLVASRYESNGRASRVNEKTRKPSKMPNPDKVRDVPSHIAEKYSDVSLYIDHRNRMAPLSNSASQRRNNKRKNANTAHQHTRRRRMILFLGGVVLVLVWMQMMSGSCERNFKSMFLQQLMILDPVTVQVQKELPQNHHNNKTIIADDTFLRVSTRRIYCTNIVYNTTVIVTVAI